MLALIQDSSQQVVATQTVWEFLLAGGFIMIPIGICSVVVLTLAMERWLHLRSECVVPPEIDTAIELLAAGDHEAASAAAKELDAPAGRILIAGINRRGRGIEHVERAMEDQGGKEVEKLRGNIRPLLLIASIAPLLGLLGTVMGIQDAFALIVKAGMGKPEHLAGGIEEALVTTIAGLVVAIPALLIASHLNTKVRRLMIETDEKLTPAVDLMVPNAS